MTRAPAERNVSGVCMQDRFAPLERGDQLEVGISINIASLRDEELAKTILLRKQEVIALHRGASVPTAHFLTSQGQSRTASYRPQKAGLTPNLLAYAAVISL